MISLFLMVEPADDFWAPLWQMTGPDFLLTYFGWFLLLWFTVIFCRIFNYDTFWLTVGGIVLFEGVGALRYWVGRQHGEHKWELMVVMMIVGLFLFLVRFDKSNGSSSSGNCGGGSSCGSDGGGGGGCGGGCGGCGS